MEPRDFNGSRVLALEATSMGIDLEPKSIMEVGFSRPSRQKVMNLANSCDLWKGGNSILFIDYHKG